MNAGSGMASYVVKEDSAKCWVLAKCITHMHATVALDSPYHAHLACFAMEARRKRIMRDGLSKLPAYSSLFISGCH